jgi:hypothetical protein
VLDCEIIYILLITEHNGDISPEKKHIYKRACTVKDVNTDECFKVNCLRKWKYQPVNNPFGFQQLRKAVEITV